MNTPYSDFAEGDHVARNLCGFLDDGVHLVQNMSADGMCAEFRCVLPPSTGWIGAGEVEYNLCRRYSRVEFPGTNLTTGQNHEIA
jgi:hypothetical protein